MTPTWQYAANLAALRLLATLHPGQTLSFKECEVLRKYSGWADGKVRSLAFSLAGEPSPQLAPLLTNLGAKVAISAESLSAYYTPAEVCSAMWQYVIKLLGRTPDFALEPSAGTGRFLDTAPDNVRGMAVESDKVSALILAALHPTWDVRHTPLEKAGLASPMCDLVIGNVPFGDWGVSDTHCPPSLRAKHLQRKVHDYFICKAVSLLHKGGICALITHRSTLDRQEVAVREWIAARCELVSAFRLPSELWEAQGASPCADILFLRRNSAKA